MVLRTLATTGLALLSLLSTASAQDAASASTTVGGGLSFAINVPSNSSDALFLNFRLPAGRTSWGAFGLGSSMTDTLMFVVYPNAAGNGITVSPRLSTGHVMPQHDDSVKFTLLPGSGIENDSYSVKGMCENCRSWSGGSLDTTSDSQQLIWASGPATPSVASDDLNARINVHQAKGLFSIDMKTASGTPGVPSFPLSDTTTTGSDNNRGDPFDSGRPTFFSKSPLIVAHGFLMVFVFLIVLPAGYAVLRLFDKVLIHASIQVLGFLLVLISTALGIVCSKQYSLVSFLPHSTPVLSKILITPTVTRHQFRASDHRPLSPNNHVLRPPSRRNRPRYLPQIQTALEIHDRPSHYRPYVHGSRARELHRRLPLCERHSTHYRLHCSSCYHLGWHYSVGTVEAETAGEEGRDEYAGCDEL